MDQDQDQDQDQDHLGCTFQKIFATPGALVLPNVKIAYTKNQNQTAQFHRGIVYYSSWMMMMSIFKIVFIHSLPLVQRW